MSLVRRRVKVDGQRSYLHVGKSPKSDVLPSNPWSVLLSEVRQGGSSHRYVNVIHSGETQVDVMGRWRKWCRSLRRLGR
jgi:hypothetical protein